MPSAYERLKRWRDVGDGPIGYTAGDGNFGADVKSLLSEVEQLRAAEQVRASEPRAEFDEVVVAADLAERHLSDRGRWKDYVDDVRFVATSIAAQLKASQKQS